MLIMYIDGNIPRIDYIEGGKMIRRIIQLVLLAVITAGLTILLASCGDNDYNNRDSSNETVGEAAFLMEEYEKYVNDNDWNSLLYLFQNQQREEMERLSSNNVGPHSLGNVDFGDYIAVDNVISRELHWVSDSDFQNHDAIETYLVEVNYIAPLDADDLEWIGLPFGQTKDRYLAFIAAKDDNVWRFLRIIKPKNLTEAVEKELLTYERTEKGDLNTLDLQLFEEIFPPLAYNKELGEEDGDFSDTNGFFRSFYSEAKGIDLEEFMRYFGRKKWINEETNKEELEEIARLYKEKTGRALDDQLIFAPPIKYSKSNVDEVLMEYAGITSDDLDQTGFESLLYSSKYEAYYNFTSDFDPGTFSPDEGYIEGDTYTFFEHIVNDSEEGFYDVRTIIKRRGDSYIIVSREKL